MKCKCGNEFSIRMATKAEVKGCEILTAMTVVITAKCTSCGAVFQIPVSSSAMIVDKNQP
ncbi:MAG: hypothetical protein ABIG95_03655 [Candidatus Woesearchaeota archaeon]